MLKRIAALLRRRSHVFGRQGAVTHCVGRTQEVDSPWYRHTSKAAAFSDHNDCRLSRDLVISVLNSKGSHTVHSNALKIGWCCNSMSEVSQNLFSQELNTPSLWLAIFQRVQKTPHCLYVVY
jgi:hypothetical protein